MTLSSGRRGLLVLALVLVAWFAVPMSAVAQKLPDYDAKAGMLKIGPDPEHPDAEIFHVAYTLKGADPATRPVTFVFNGGPGAASIYLHLSAIGPKSLVSAGDGVHVAGHRVVGLRVAGLAVGPGQHAAVAGAHRVDED